MILDAGHPSTALRWVALLCACGLLVATLEKLASRDDHADAGVVPWRIVQFAHPRAGATERRRSALATVYSERGSTVLLVVRLAALPLVLLAQPLGPWFSLGIVVTAGTTLLLDFRQRYGSDGGEQMLAIVVVTLALTATAWTSPVARELGVLFIAGQALLAYTVSGLAKVVSPVWRSGAAVPAIVSTTSFGYDPATRLLRAHPWLGRAVTRSVVLFEVGFPLVLVLPPPLALAVLGAGLAFHLGTALVMGLNNFVWAFVATYPAVYVLAITVPDLSL